MANQQQNQDSKKQLFDGQHEDESVLLMFRRHPIMMRKGLIGLLLVLLIGMIPSAIWPENLSNLWYAALGLGVGLVFLFYSWIGWYFSVVIVTDQRLIQITQKGLFNRTVADVGLEKIQSINYQIAGVQQTLLGYGTILVQTFVGDLMLEKIHKPQRIQEKLVKIVKDLGYNNVQFPDGSYPHDTPES